MTSDPSISAIDVAARGLLRGIAVRTAATGTLLCEGGSPATEAILLVNGIVEAVDGPEVYTRQLIAGTGEPPVFVRGLRARTEVRVARVPVDRLEAAAPGQAAALTEVLLDRLLRRELVANASAIFGDLDGQALADIDDASDWVDLKRGGILMRQGDTGDRVFVLLSGRLQAVHEGANGASRVVGDIAAGETVGEMSFFTGEPRSATVRAVRDSLLIGLDRAIVDRLIATRPSAMRHIIKVQIDRVRRANSGVPLRAPLTNIAVVPLDDLVPTGQFCRDLASALEPFGAVVHVDAERLDQRLQQPGLADSPEDGPESTRLAAWLEELERAARFVVYETSARHPGWVARSISRADCVVLVGRGSGDPAPTEIERIVAREEGEHGAAQRLLVLLHDDEALPSGTSRWTAARAVSRHHHVRLSRPGDIARVARFLADRAVGLVLGAGGARGFAHIGVLRVLQEAGIPIDLVAGTSMGSAMAAQHAMGWSPDRIMETADDVWNRIRPHTEYTLPLLSLVRGQSAQKCGEMMYGTTCIEDLWLPYFCVSADLTDASMYVHRDGSLLLAVTASSSLPAVIVPTQAGDHLLCDGSLFNTLPVNLARASGCGTVIASRVSVPQDKDFVYEQIPSLREVLGAKLRRRPLRYPSIMSVLLRSSMLAAVDQENKESLSADLLFAPALEQFGLMEFTALKQIAAVGEADARRQVAEWQAEGRLARIPRERTGE
ncbi:cyclic nucleotide-binding protein [Luteitalea sp. TBR-22]|uniref:cyclic nucleotide-binding domain-containing protein n=1 Tax=Luteitalea sp. TBR-22 TaxID=2802971 RepID=UPI001AFA77F3|nr:cyclic nucleotide-binding domain-containing protein [Luteitalea sp. TBR-22]BCS31809.1 cyclic nucleotide-binding protein [Luteitalea sp. TBR-22]